MADSASDAAVQIEIGLGGRVEVDLFCLNYFPREYGGFTKDLDSKARIRKVVQNHGEAEVKAKQARWHRHLAQGYIDRPASTQTDAPAALSDLDLGQLHPDAPFHPSGHIDSSGLKEKVVKALDNHNALMILSPVRQGKSWWRDWLASHYANTPGKWVIKTDFAIWGQARIRSERQLLELLSADLQTQLRLELEEIKTLKSVPKGMDDVWQAIKVWKSRPEHAASRLIWVMDNLQLLDKAEIVDALFAPMRALLQRTPWATVALLMSTYIDKSMFRSAFALGPSEKIEDFTIADISRMSELYNQNKLIQTGNSLSILKHLTSGCPYLCKTALHSSAKVPNLTWVELLEEATTLKDGGTLFRAHMSMLRNVISEEELLILQRIYSGSESRNQTKPNAHHLLKYGIIHKLESEYVIRCPLYLHLLRKK